jgi:hypothetical protein
MTTGPGSANEALWSELVTLGWMAKRAEALDLPGGRRFEMTIYSISVEGLQPISDSSKRWPDFVNELLTQDTNGASPQPNDAPFRGFTALQELDSLTPDFRLKDF